MSKYHVIISNSDGEMSSFLNLSLVGMLNIIFDRWEIKDDEDILSSLKKHYDNMPTRCIASDDQTYEIFISNGDTLSRYDINRLFETEKALLRWARTQIRRKLSEQTKE